MNLKIQFLFSLKLKKCLYLFSFLFVFSEMLAMPFNVVNKNEENFSINLKEVQILEVFDMVEKKTRYTFVFDETISSSKQRLTLLVNKESINTVLSKITAQTGFQFNRINNTISVTKSPLIQQLIRGKVNDSRGLPLPGASVLEKGTTNSTTTDFDGNFSLSTSKANAILVVSYIGFDDKEVSANNSAPLVIRLTENTNALNEVVVTALGIKRQEKQLGFSQQSISADNLAQTAPNNWSAGLKGKVAGLNIISSGSGPLNSQQITLRGNNSLNPNGNNALIVVDGVPINS